jgi:hypothetical protein
MDFFEPEDEYKTDKQLRFNFGNKSVALSLFLILSIILLVVVQRDIFGFFDKDYFKEKCDFSSTHIRVDDEGLTFEKIKKALSDNEGTLKQIEGFVKAEVREVETINSNRDYVISLYLKKEAKVSDKIPDFICGHKVIIENK